MTDGRVTLAPYDASWADSFDRERVTLVTALDPWLSAGVEHIGSTAIPGIAAKPIIDMIAGVRDLHEASAAEPVLLNLGYARGEHRPDEAHYFFKPAVEHWWQRTHQLHLAEQTSNLWRERLAFRDALRADPAVASQYEDLKRQLADTSRDLPDYAENKREFVGRVLASVGVSLADR